MKFLITATLLAFSLSPSSAMAQEKDGDYSALMAALGMKQLNGEDLEQAIAEAEAFPLGSDRNPVRVDGPSGERHYLSRLRCEDGQAPTFDRTGNVGTGVFGNIVDLYSVRCTGGLEATDVFMDMYHRKYKENRPIPGFVLAP